MSQFSDDKQDEQDYGDKMGESAKMGVNGYLWWTDDAQEAVNSLLTGTALEVWKMKISLAEPCSGNISTSSGNNSINQFRQ